MKNKVITALLMATVMFSLTACGGSAGPSAPDLANRGNSTEEVAATEEETKETEEEVVEEPEEKKESPKASGVVFGSDEAKGYTGFEYLMEELISTSDTKSGDKVSYSAFVPDGDYPSVSGSRARCDRMGVTVEVDIDPYIQSKWQDYTMQENLEVYVENELSYSDYYGVEIGEVEQLSDECCVCEISFMEYSSWDNEYTPFYEIFCLRDMGNDVMAMIDIRIEAEETTGKTQTLLDELSSFYAIEIGWDESFADAKREAFENSDEFNADAFNLGYISFELPEGWDKDEDESTYKETCFGPKGDIYGIGYISVSKDYASDKNVVDAMLSDIDYTKSYFEELSGATDLKIEDEGETFLGKTLKIELIDDGDTCIIYMAQDDYTVYQVYAVVWEGEGAEADAEIRAALDKLFETGTMR